MSSLLRRMRAILDPTASSCQRTKHLVDHMVEFTAVAHSFRSKAKLTHPGVKLSAAYQYLADDLIVRQGHHRTMRETTQGPHTQTRVRGQLPEREEAVVARLVHVPSAAGS